MGTLELTEGEFQRANEALKTKKIKLINCLQIILFFFNVLYGVLRIKPKVLFISIKMDWAFILVMSL